MGLMTDGRLLRMIAEGMDGNHLPIGVEFSRPTNTDAYAAKDVIANSTSAPTVLTFTNAALENGGGGYILKARALTNQSTCVARLRLHLYRVAPTAINDNALFTLLWENRANRIGTIDFPALSTEGSGSDCAYTICTPGSTAPGNVPLEFTCAADSKNLFGILETLDVFTPANAQAFYIELALGRI